MAIKSYYQVTITHHKIIINSALFCIGLLFKGNLLKTLLMLLVFGKSGAYGCEHEPFSFSKTKIKKAKTILIT